VNIKKLLILFTFTSSVTVLSITSASDYSSSKGKKTPQKKTDWQHMPNIDSKLFKKYQGTEFTDIRFIGLTQSERKDLEHGIKNIFNKNNKYIFTFKSILTARQIINEYLFEKGFVYSQVGQIDLKNKILIIDVWKRPIKKVDFSGRMAQKEILKFLMLEPGMLYNLHQLEKRTNKLYRNPLFSQIKKISITPFFLPEDGLLIELKITEKDRNQFDLGVDSDWHLGPKYFFSYKHQDFWTTENSLDFNSILHADLRNINRVKLMAGFSDLDQENEKNIIRYRLNLFFEHQGQSVIDVEKNYLSEKSIGTDDSYYDINFKSRQFPGALIGLYMIQKSENWKNFSRFLGYHGTPFVSFLDYQYVATAYNGFRLGIRLDDTDYVILPYRASTAQLGVGLQSYKNMGSYSFFGFYKINYKIETAFSQYVNINSASVVNRRTDYYDHYKMWGQEYSFDPGGNTLYSNFFLSGFHYFWGLFDTLFFIGPGIVYRHIGAVPKIVQAEYANINFLEFGISCLYVWDRLELKIAFGQIQALELNDPNWALSFYMYYSF
jgi:hypothetical protein